MVSDRPWAIAQLTNLTELSLSNNQLIEISEESGQLTQLERFSVSGGEIKEIPDAIGQLVNLMELLIYRTQVEI